MAPAGENDSMIGQSSALADEAAQNNARIANLLLSLDAREKAQETEVRMCG